MHGSRVIFGTRGESLFVENDSTAVAAEEVVVAGNVALFRSRVLVSSGGGVGSALVLVMAEFIAWIGGMAEGGGSLTEAGFFSHAVIEDCML